MYYKFNLKKKFQFQSEKTDCVINGEWKDDYEKFKSLVTLCTTEMKKFVPKPRQTLRAISY